MRLLFNLLLLGSSSALVSIFQPFYEEIVKYAKIGTLLVIEEANNSKIWDSQELLPFQATQKAYRIQNITNLFDDIDAITLGQAVDFILDYNDEQIQLFGLTWDDLRVSFEQIFFESSHDIATVADDVSALIFDKTNDGYLTLQQEELLMDAITNYVALLNDLHILFELDVEDWSGLLTDFFDHGLNFYVHLNDVFEFKLNTYIEIAVDFSALVIQTFAEIKDSRTEYNSLIGWTDLCGSTSIFTYGTQWTSFGIYLTPRWIDVTNDYLSFWNEIVDTFLFDANVDYKMPLLEPGMTETVDGYFDSAKRTIAELELMTMPFKAQINAGIKNLWKC